MTTPAIERRLELEQSAKIAGLAHLYVGQEAVAVGRGDCRAKTASDQDVCA